MPIRVEISKDMLDQVRRFSEDVLSETYDRFSKDEHTRFERIFVGKLGELIFSAYLGILNVPHDITGMFEVYQGTTNVDPFDFVIPLTSETVDVKTAYRDYHSRVLIPYGRNGQWDQMPKDYYVGVKLRQCVNPDGSIDVFGTLNPFAYIFGYLPRRHAAWHGPHDFGEGPCMWATLKQMRPIEELVKKFRVQVIPIC